MKTTLIGITGPKKSGKDFVCSILRNKIHPIQSVRLAFADALKQEISLAVGKPVSYIDEHKDNFRLILQGWGTDYRRRLFGERYWLDKWEAAYEFVQNGEILVIVPDVRFENEAILVREKGGIIVQIVPKNNKVELDSHSSEQGIQQEHVTFQIVNDFYTSSNTVVQVNSLISKIL